MVSPFESPSLLETFRFSNFPGKTKAAGCKYTPLYFSILLQRMGRSLHQYPISQQYYSSQLHLLLRKHVGVPNDQKGRFSKAVFESVSRHNSRGRLGNLIRRQNICSMSSLDSLPSRHGHESSQNVRRCVHRYVLSGSIRVCTAIGFHFASFGRFGVWTYLNCPSVIGGIGALTLAGYGPFSA